jgi:diguanylate cyclase (GGDEF)-like protein
VLTTAEGDCRLSFTILRHAFIACLPIYDLGSFTQEPIKQERALWLPVEGVQVLQGQSTQGEPAWSWTAWLAHAGDGVPDDIRAALIARLYGTLPVFIAGAINTIVVSAVIAARIQSVAFLLWLAFEVSLCVARMAVLLCANRAIAMRLKCLTDLHIFLALCWGASVGYGVYICMSSGDWVASTLSCLSAAAMVGGICFRSFSAPRLATAIMILALGPVLVGAANANEPLLYTVFLQGPLYVAAMSLAAFHLNRMLIETMRAHRHSDYLAKHDALTGLSNRVGLMQFLGRSRSSAVDKVALIYIDLDEFKSVNDTYGHSAGDRVLVMAADRLRSFATANVEVARLGGDEFVLAISPASADEALQLTARVAALLQHPYELMDHTSIMLGGSVGTAVSEGPADSIETLLMRADRAAYEDKFQRRCARAAQEVSRNVRVLRQLTRAPAEDDTSPPVAAPAALTRSFR